ncbi:MAG: hypothetical protein DCC68_20965 [Planctomycetota bacterium]|nr:MAG: hypothetical protein DCC68_20965 [Planctomycetota bacterium]
MSTVTQPFDVFIVHAPTDAAFARKVAQRLTDSGFNVLDDDWAEPGIPYGDAIREAINNSDAVVVLSTPASLDSEYVFLELGAATAWDKPIFVVRSGVSSDDLPVSLSPYWNCPVSELSKLTATLKSRLREELIRLSDEERAWLAKACADVGLPIDELEYYQLEGIADRVSRRSGKRISAETVMQELIRQRKQDKLPPIRRR